MSRPLDWLTLDGLRVRAADVVAYAVDDRRFVTVLYLRDHTLTVDGDFREALDALTQPVLLAAAPDDDDEEGAS